MWIELLFWAGVTLPWGLYCVARVWLSAPPRPSRPRRWLVPAAAGLLAVVWALSLYGQDLWFLGNGAATVGMVTRTEGRGGKYGYLVSYEFVDAGGARYKGRQKLDVCLPTGEAVSVRYLPDDPTQNRLIARWSQRSLMADLLPVAVAVTLCGWACFAVAAGRPPGLRDSLSRGLGLDGTEE